MDDYAELERLLSEGYLVVGPVRPLGGFSPESIRIPIKVFSIKTDPEVLLDPSNAGKSLILLRPASGTKPPFEMITSDERTVRRADEQSKYQMEPVAMIVSAHCVALGGSSASERILHLDQLVPSLNGLHGWTFKLGDIRGTMEVETRVESTNRADALEVIQKLERLLDCLAIVQQVGFHIQHYSFADVPRLYPVYVKAYGPTERMLKAVSRGEIDAVESLLSSSQNSGSACGLRQAYCELLPASRLWRLWAALEGAFGNKPERLLAKKEVAELVKCAKCIDSLAGDDDRITRLEQGLMNPIQLPLMSRNWAIATEIASVMGISAEDAYSKVTKASEMRAKSGHGLSSDLSGIEASEKFCQEALRCYLTRQKTL